MQRVLAAYEHDWHDEELLVFPTAAWSSLPVDAQSKQGYWLRTFRVPH